MPQAQRSGHIRLVSNPLDHLAAPDGRSLPALWGVVLHCLGEYGGSKNLCQDCPELSVGWATSQRSSGSDMGS